MILRGARSIGHIRAPPAPIVIGLGGMGNEGKSDAIRIVGHGLFESWINKGRIGRAAIYPGGGKDWSVTAT